MDNKEKVRYLSGEEALQIDKELMEDIGYQLEQLMELAGLSCAQAVFQEFPPSKYKKILVVVGPGNNGGDALVVARHLILFGYENVTIWIPKEPVKDVYKRLYKQALYSGCVAKSNSCTLDSFNLIVDGIFGFSFKLPVREPYRTALEEIKESKVDIVSIDVPSGWDVENGPVGDLPIDSKVVISLTAPKNCMKQFKGIHYLGGRFIPPKLAQKWDLRLPTYPLDQQILKLTP